MKLGLVLCEKINFIRNNMNIYWIFLFYGIFWLFEDFVFFYVNYFFWGEGEWFLIFFWMIFEVCFVI